MGITIDELREASDIKVCQANQLLQDGSCLVLLSFVILKRMELCFEAFFDVIHDDPRRIKEKQCAVFLILSPLPENLTTAQRM